MSFPYIVLDLETTGLSKHYHKITEIAAVKVKDKKIVDEFQTLVNPKVSIPPFITKLTGINNKMVESAPTLSKVLPHFIDFLKEDVIIAHNATFDYGFIDHNKKKYLEEGLINDRICTRRLANRLLPDLPSKKLGTICQHFNIINSQAHRAMSDVLATNEVFLNFQNLMEEKGIKEKKEVIKFQNSPRK